MSNSLHLTPGQKYKIIKAFADYDKIQHPVGETWTFVTTNFLPYDDGLTLHIKIDNFQKELSYRFQWRNEEQADILEHFDEYVEAINGREQ